MNPRLHCHILRTWRPLLCASLAIALFTGCRTGTYMKADSTAGALQRAGNEVRTEIALIDSVTNSLHDLIANPSGDLRIQVGRFSDAVTQLEKTAHHAADRGATLRKDGAAYFAAWDKQLQTVTDEQIHQSSANRKLEVAKQFDSSMQRYDDAQNAMNPLISYLRDIRTSLSVDLTTAGVQSAKAPAATATQQAFKAREGLTRSIADLDALAAKMSFFAPPAQPAVK